jgi:hypothetical protein
MSAPVWINPTSNFEIIPNNEVFSANLQVQLSTVAGSAKLISGAFPNGITITNQAILDNVLTITISGTVQGSPDESLYRFTLRASDATGAISDQRFSARVHAIEPFVYTSTITQVCNIGIFPDGSFINVALPVTDPTLNSNGNISFSLFSGALPSGLNLTANGMLYGFPYPSQLLETNEGFDDISWDNSPFDLDPSLVSKSYAFNVEVSDGYQIGFVPFSITIERSDIFANANANVSEEYFHAPIFTNANIVNTPGSDVSTLDLGTFSTDSYFYYQLQGFDFENDEIAFDIQPAASVQSQNLYSTSTGIAIANPVASIPLLPSNVSLNGNTGWLSGYLNELSTSFTNYEFYARVFKVFSEPYESTINVDYAVDLPFSIVNYTNQIAINSLAIDDPTTNFDGSTLIFVQGDNFANDYSFGNIVGLNTSNTIVATNNPWGNASTGNTVPFSQQNGIWQFQRITNELNPRTGNVESFYQLNYLEAAPSNVGIIADKTIITSANSLTLVNNIVERNEVFELATLDAVTTITFQDTTNSLFYSIYFDDGNMEIDQTNSPVAPIFNSLTFIDNVNGNYYQLSFSDGNMDIAQETMPGQNLFGSFPLLDTVNGFTYSLEFSNGLLDIVQSATPSNVTFSQITSMNPYESFLLISMDLAQDFSQTVVWDNGSGLGNIISGVPVQLELSASITNESLSTENNPATTEVFMQLVSANINSTGQSYSIGDVLTVIGGTFSNAATVTVANVGLNGQVTSITLGTVANQMYSALPALSNTLVTGGTGSGASLDLSFGVESVVVTFAGQYNNGLSVGFTSANETIAATANCLLLNGQITAINVTNPGAGYTFIPLALINEVAFQLAPAINYELISGSLPLGLQLFSNGMIAGRPSFQNASNSNVQTFSFTAQASVGLNSVESGEEFTNNLTSTQTYTLLLNNNGQPITNMYLGLLLSEGGNDVLFSALNNNQLIPSSIIYREYDPYFGVVSSLRSLMAYGLGTNANLLANIQTTLSEYHNAKTLIFDSLMLVPAVDVYGNNPYSVIALVLRDEYTTVNGNSYSGQVSVDEQGTIVIADPGTQPNMINQLIEYLGPFNANYQPLWLQNTIIDTTVIGSKILIPLVYTIPEAGPDVLFNLQTYFSGANALNNLTFFTDRYVWDAGMIINFDLDTNSFPANATPDSYLVTDEGSSYLIFPKRNILY